MAAFGESESCAFIAFYFTIYVCIQTSNSLHACIHIFPIERLFIALQRTLRFDARTSHLSARFGLEAIYNQPSDIPARERRRLHRRDEALDPAGVPQARGPALVVADEGEREVLERRRRRLVGVRRPGFLVCPGYRGAWEEAYWVVVGGGGGG